MPMIGVVPSARMCDYEAAMQRVGGELRVLDPMHDDPGTGHRASTASCSPAAATCTRSCSVSLRTRRSCRPSPGRDEHEIALVTAAIDARVPIFAICRGVQVLNVACGGTLVQDIPASIPGAVTHQVELPKSAIAHEVWINRGSRLWTLLEERLEGEDTCSVNSRHHQSVKALAKGFVVSATAPDGVIEAIERPDLPFCLGVQWHPENFWRSGEFRELFEGFLRAASERRAERSAE